MTTTLLFLALLAAVNPLRVQAVGPKEMKPGVLCYAGVVVLAVGTASACLSGPLLGLLDVSVSSARIAAGVALVAVAAWDAVGPVPRPEPSLTGSFAGIVPVAFPAVLNPATVFLMIAAGADRGAIRAVAVMTVVVVTAMTALVFLGYLRFDLFLRLPELECRNWCARRDGWCSCDLSESSASHGVRSDLH